MADRETIIVFVRGGVIQDIQFPEGCRTAVSVHDYDVEGANEADPHRDDHGDSFFRALWEPPDVQAETPEDGDTRALAGIPEVDELPEAEARNILAEIFRWMYWDYDGEQWDPEKEIGGADTVQVLCELMPGLDAPTGGGP